MRVALIDVDGHNFPNLPLMEISAYVSSKAQRNLRNMTIKEDKEHKEKS